MSDVEAVIAEAVDAGFDHAEMEALLATGRIIGLLGARCNPTQMVALGRHIEGIQGIVTDMAAARRH